MMHKSSFQEPWVQVSSQCHQVLWLARGVQGALMLPPCFCRKGLVRNPEAAARTGRVSGNLVADWQSRSFLLLSPVICPVLFFSLVPVLVKCHRTLPCCTYYNFYFVKMSRGLWAFCAKKCPYKESPSISSPTLLQGQTPSFDWDFLPFPSPNKLKSEKENYCYLMTLNKKNKTQLLKNHAISATFSLKRII